MSKTVPLSGWLCIRLIVKKDGKRHVIEYPVCGSNDRQRQESIDGYSKWMKQQVLENGFEYLCSIWVKKES